MSLRVHRTDGNEEDVSGIEAKGPRRDQLILAVAGNDDALPIEVVVYGTSGNDEIRCYRADFASLETGMHLAVDRSGAIYIAETALHRIVRIVATGR